MKCIEGLLVGTWTKMRFTLIFLIAVTMLIHGWSRKLRQYDRIDVSLSSWQLRCAIRAWVGVVEWVACLERNGWMGGGGRGGREWKLQTSTTTISRMSSENRECERRKLKLQMADIGTNIIN